MAGRHGVKKCQKSRTASSCQVLHLVQSLDLLKSTWCSCGTVMDCLCKARTICYHLVLGYILEFSIGLKSELWSCGEYSYYWAVLVLFLSPSAYLYLHCVAWNCRTGDSCPIRSSLLSSSLYEVHITFEFIA